MLFGGGRSATAKPVKKVAKKVVKKVVKKPLKKVRPCLSSCCDSGVYCTLCVLTDMPILDAWQAAPKARALTSRERRAAPKAANEPGTAPGTIVTDFFSEKNWLYVAGTLLAGNSVGEKEAEFPVTPVLIVGAWILVVLRFVVFYGFFGTD